jgi:hypothetical protein
VSGEAERHLLTAQVPNVDHILNASSIHLVAAIAESNAEHLRHVGMH